MINRIACQGNSYQVFLQAFFYFWNSPRASNSHHSRSRWKFEEENRLLEDRILLVEINWIDSFLMVIGIQTILNFVGFGWGEEIFRPKKLNTDCHRAHLIRWICLSSACQVCMIQPRAAYHQPKICNRDGVVVGSSDHALSGPTESPISYQIVRRSPKLS